MNRSKLLLYTLIFTALLTPLLGAPINELLDIYQKDYTVVNRVVLVFDQKPNFSIEQDTQNNLIKIKLPDTKKGINTPLSMLLDTSTIKDIRLNDGANDILTLNVKTKDVFFLESFSIATPPYKVVLDVFNIKTPSSDAERLEFGKFYFSTSNFSKAEDVLKTIVDKDRHFSGALYYLGVINLNKGNEKLAIENFKKVKPAAQEFFKAQYELIKLDALDIEFNEESELLLSKLYSYFITLKDLNSQQLALAYFSFFFENLEETESLLSGVDADDPELISLIDTFNHSYSVNSSKQPFLSLLTLRGTRDNRRNAPLSYLILVGVSLISIFLTLLFSYLYWRKRIEKILLGCREEAKTEYQIIPNDYPEQKESKVNSAQVTETQAETKDVHSPDQDINIEPRAIESESLKNKLISQLYNKGWTPENISKELYVDIEHVNKVINHIKRLN